MLKILKMLQPSRVSSRTRINNEVMRDFSLNLGLRVLPFAGTYWLIYVYITLNPISDLSIFTKIILIIITTTAFSFFHFIEKLVSVLLYFSYVVKIVFRIQIFDDSFLFVYLYLRLRCTFSISVTKNFYQRGLKI